MPPTATILPGPIALTDADDPVIEIGDQGQFTPTVLTVAIGTTVTWENSRRSASSTASDVGALEYWDSGSMYKAVTDPEPARFTHTFTILGCHKYRSEFSGDIGTGAVCVVP